MVGFATSWLFKRKKDGKLFDGDTIEIFEVGWFAEDGESCGGHRLITKAFAAIGTMNQLTLQYKKPTKASAKKTKRSARVVSGKVSKRFEAYRLHLGCFSISFTAPAEATTKSLLRSWKPKLEGVVSTKTFVYSPLPSPNSIRLLALEPFDHKNPTRVCCTLSFRSFSRSAQHSLTYTALSYVWGEAADLYHVQLDNLRFMV